MRREMLAMLCWGLGGLGRDIGGHDLSCMSNAKARMFASF